MDLNITQRELAYLHVKSLWIDFALIEFTVFSLPFLKITSILNEAQTCVQVTKGYKLKQQYPHVMTFTEGKYNKEKL